MSLLTAHSEKESAPTYKRGLGFIPLCAFVESRPRGTGEPVAMMLRPDAPAPTPATDHHGRSGVGPNAHGPTRC